MLTLALLLLPTTTPRRHTLPPEHRMSLRAAAAWVDRQNRRERCWERFIRPVRKRRHGHE
jgi:hypothetical protein